MLKTLIVIPTFFERENLSTLLPDLLSSVAGADLLIVDDGSSDGTQELLTELSAFDPRVHSLIRDQKQGLGRAYLAGFAWAVERDYEYVVQMDADHSHRTADLTNLLAQRGRADFIIGSRRVRGGGVRNWGSHRRFLSWAGNLYTRFFLGHRVADWTGGFNVWNIRVLKALLTDDILSQGFIFQVELKYRALKLNFSAIEVPIIFEERREGHSKMSFRIIAEALTQVWRLGSRLSHLSQ